jgi:transcription antitermination factor NusG
METEQSLPRWFALRVKSRCEKVVALAVSHKGYEEFLPLYTSRQRWSDRLRSVAVPLLPGYVFCRLLPEHRLPLLTIPGVLNFVEFGKVPVPIDDAEIAALQIAVRSNIRTEPCLFPEGADRVRLTAGPLAGLEVFLTRDREPRRAIVALSALKRSVTVDIEESWLGSLKAADQKSDQILIAGQAVGSQ